MYLAVINVEPLKDYKLLLTFENGEKRRRCQSIFGQGYFSRIEG